MRLNLKPVSPTSPDIISSKDQLTDKSQITTPTSQDWFSPRRRYLEFQKVSTPIPGTPEEDSPVIRRSLELDRWISVVKRERRNSQENVSPIKPENMTLFLLQKTNEIEENQLVKYLQEMPEKQKFAAANLFILVLGHHKSAKNLVLQKILKLMLLEPHHIEDVIALLEKTQSRQLPLQFYACKIEEKYRWIVIWSFFVLFVTFEKYYDARVRSAFLALANSLDINSMEIYQEEDAIASELNRFLKEIRDELKKEDQRVNTNGKYLLFGTLSALGGGALLLTGGLATPVVLPMMTTLMTSMGLVGTISGIGTVASVTASKQNMKLTDGGVLLSNLFGKTELQLLECEGECFEFYRILAKPIQVLSIPTIVYSSHMKFSHVDLLDKDIFVLKSDVDYDVKNDLKVVKTLPKFNQKFTNNKDVDSHSLNMILGVSGMTLHYSIEDVWTSLMNHSKTGELYTLLWEKDLLMNFGKVIEKIKLSPHAADIRQYWFNTLLECKTTNTISIQQSLSWPMVFFDEKFFNPLGLMLQSSERNGKILANLLMSQVQGKRPITLIGISHGANLIFSCLEELAKHKADGIVENVFFVGATISCANASRWSEVRKIIPGRIVNAYSLHDWILVYLFRSSLISYEVAGLQPCFEKLGIQNVDISDLIDDHYDYDNIVKLHKIWEVVEINQSYKIVYA